MSYEVYNERHVSVTVTDEQIEEALKQPSNQLKIEIVSAMGMSRKHHYAPRLIEVMFNHEKQSVRIKAIYGLLSLMNSDCIPALEKREQILPEADFKMPISEKAILQSVIIRLKEGPEGALAAFFNDSVPPIVKSLLLHNYYSYMPLNIQDVYFITAGLEAYINKSEPWIRNLDEEEYEDDIIAPLEGLMRESEESLLLSQLPEELIKKLCAIGQKILTMKIDSYAKEAVASFAKALPPQAAYQMLKPIMDGRARGDLRKELNQTLKILQQKEPVEE